MKKNRIVAALLVAGFSSAAFAGGDGQVNFTGEITDTACTIANTVANPLNVDLGKVARTELDGGANKTTARKGFVIALTSCPAALDGTNAKVRFDGTPATGNSDVLALTNESGVATGVGIQLSNSDGSALPLLQDSIDYPLTGGDNNLNFMAGYISTAAAVTAGPANGTANFSVVYN